MIEAALKPSKTARVSFTTPRFAKRLPEQLGQLRAELQAQPVRMKAAAQQIKPAVEKQFESVREHIQEIPDVEQQFASVRDRIQEIPDQVKTNFKNNLE